MSIIGQTHLNDILQTASLQTLPHSIVLSGEEGSGRKTFCSELAASLGIESRIFEGKIDQEFVLDCFLRTQPFMLIFAGDKLQEKDQNALLKLAEEPGENIYILIIVEALNTLIPTLLNRCQIWQMSNYSRDTLQAFLESEADAELILSLAETPGQVRAFQQLPLAEMQELAIKMVDSIDRAAFPNTLTITNQIGFKEEKAKFPYREFSKVLLKAFRDKIILSEEPKYQRGYILTDRYIHNWKMYPRLDQRELFEHFLTTLWKEVRIVGTSRS